MLLSTAMLEGWVQQSSPLNIWLPLLSPQGEALAEELVATGSFSFVETPQNSGFKGAYCFDWRGPNTTRRAPRSWPASGGRSQIRVRLSAHSGLCPGFEHTY